MLPQIKVCWHDGNWFCRTGNRRLAALRLAYRVAPGRVRYMKVQAIAADRAFADGVFGKRPKLTTHLNGTHCRGRWIRIKETGAAIGDVDHGPEYGLDLLQLLAASCRSGSATS